MLKVFHSEKHRQHNPPVVFFEGGVPLTPFESPGRIDRILNSLTKTTWANINAPADFGMKPIIAVHDADYVQFLKTAWDEWVKVRDDGGGKFSSEVFTPAYFAMRRSKGIPSSFIGRAGYYSTDTNAPIVAGTYGAAIESANLALSAAKSVIDGDRCSLALCRPPGHHAGRDFDGGFCYLNNAAIAATFLSSKFRVALLDIDFHGGNGTQDIFYESADVLMVSLHGDPAEFYPSYTGYANETGEGAGTGFNFNFPLPRGTSDKEYLATLDKALNAINKFGPTALVISLGMDILASDPLGGFKITFDGLSKISQKIKGLNLPSVICLEGGYSDDIGEGIVQFASCFN